MPDIGMQAQLERNIWDGEMQGKSLNTVPKTGESRRTGQGDNTKNACQLNQKQDLNETYKFQMK